ncbi:MAG: hypothetical protein Q4F13_06810 [Pseudomonadota bacterium]|nr:hypothetical protein [Pseudomonadota bacterium]
MKRYSCNQLGVCHCDGACASGKVFAPGVIEAHPAPRPRWRRWAIRAAVWAWNLVSALCVVTVLLGLWGMARGHGSAAPAAGVCATAAQQGAQP